MRSDLCNLLLKKMQRDGALQCLCPGSYSMDECDEFGTEADDAGADLGEIFFVTPSFQYAGTLYNLHGQDVAGYVGYGM